MRSVSPRRGSTFANAGITKRETRWRRTSGTPNTIASTTSTIVVISKRSGESMPTMRQPISQMPAAAIHARKPSPRNARTQKTMTASTNVTSIGGASFASDAPDYAPGGVVPPRAVRTAS